MSKKPVPKAKKGKKGKKKGGDETSLEERYKRTLQEVATLRLELDCRIGESRKARTVDSEAREMVSDMKEALEEEKYSKLEITTDMARHYKALQTQMEMRVQYLEEEVKRLTALLDDTKLKLHLVTEERDRLKKEKEEQFQVMKEKIKSLEKAYQVILEETLDSMAVKLETCRTKWSQESELMERRNLQLIQEFAL